MSVTNSEIGAYVDSLSDVGTPADDDELLVYDVSASATKKVQASALAGSAGSVATDAIWDNAGDLAVGSGANTATKLTMGATDGMVVGRASSAVAWFLPPGYEFDYVERTSGNLSVTQTAEASADTYVTGNAVTYDGSTAVIIEAFLPSARADTSAAARNLKIVLYDGSSSIGILATLTTPAANSDAKPVLLRRKLTPSAAAHTYSIRGFVSGGTGLMGAGAGGSGNDMPGYIRITKA